MVLETECPNLGPSGLSPGNGILSLRPSHGLDGIVHLVDGQKKHICLSLCLSHKDTMKETESYSLIQSYHFLETLLFIATVGLKFYLYNYYKALGAKLQ